MDGDFQREQEKQKSVAAIRSVDFVQSGMRVGLGTGSTAAFIVQEIAKRLREGRLQDILGVPTSNRTADLAGGLGIPVTKLDQQSDLDIVLDGADEVDPHLNLIKGAGGALLREKIVALAARERITVVDESKLVQRLGEKAQVPVEVVRFGWRMHLAFLSALGAEPILRQDASGKPILTDEGHYLLDCRFAGGLSDPASLAETLKHRTGIVEHGLFLRVATRVVVGTSSGVEVRQVSKIASGNP